jgi:hypothetical protein
MRPDCGERERQLLEERIDVGPLDISILAQPLYRYAKATSLNETGEHQAGQIDEQANGQAC